MKGLEQDEREALLNAAHYVMSAEQESKMLRRGLIVFCGYVGTDKHFRVTADGWLALRLDTAARRWVSA